MAKVNLAAMPVDALLKLREDIATVLGRKANDLRSQLSRLGDEPVSTKKGRGNLLKGRKAPIKYRDKSGNAWAGRGAQPVWLREKLKAGAKLADFAVDKKITSRKRSSKKRPKTKRKR
jgi:DNA-binding protein H-NS